MKSVKFDYSKLRGRIVEKGMTQGKISQDLGISPQAFSKKMQNDVRFTSEDIVALASILEIPAEELGAYFFTPIV